MLILFATLKSFKRRTEPVPKPKYRHWRRIFSVYCKRRNWVTRNHEVFHGVMTDGMTSDWKRAHPYLVTDRRPRPMRLSDLRRSAVERCEPDWYIDLIMLDSILRVHGIPTLDFRVDPDLAKCQMPGEQHLPVIDPAWRNSRIGDVVLYCTANWIVVTNVDNYFSLAPAECVQVDVEPYDASWRPDGTTVEPTISEGAS